MFKLLIETDNNAFCKDGVRDHVARRHEVARILRDLADVLANPNHTVYNGDLRDKNHNKVGRYRFYDGM